MSTIFELFERIRGNRERSQGKLEFVIAGLGNPGLQYERTRHNAGYHAIDRLAKEFQTDIKRARFKALTGEAVIEGKRCLLLKPTTYMNNSGQSLEQALGFYKIPMEKVLVLYDDISLEPGSLRIRRKGSHGGHNGIKDIIEMTGEETFARIKLGVGKKPHAAYNLADWVLSAFSGEEVKKMEIAYKNCVDAIRLIIKGNIDQAMNQYNS